MDRGSKALGDVEQAVGGVIAALCLVVPPDDVRAVVRRLGRMAIDDQDWESFITTIELSLGRGPALARAAITAARGPARFVNPEDAGEE